MSGGRKQKVRSVRKTALIYCEGAHDLAFVRHLINTYVTTGKTKVRIRTKQGNGGAPDTLVLEANNVLGSFDRRIVKLDKDRSQDEIRKAEQMSKKTGIKLIWSIPCIEALLLTIIEHKDFSRYKSKTCKQRFEAKYIPSGKRADSRAYGNLFPISIVEEARKTIPELNSLIDFIIS